MDLIPRYSLFDIPIAALSSEQLTAHILKSVESPNRHIVTNINAHAANISVEHPWFKELLQNADITYCDGFGIALAAWLLGRGPLRRAAIADVSIELLQTLLRDKRKVFLLGATSTTLEFVLKKFREDSPSGTIEGHHGYFELGGPESVNVLTKILDFSPDLLLVGMGMPRQERWILDNHSKINRGVIITVGGCFDYIAHPQLRPPAILNDHGFEWLGRLIKNPRRLWRRNLLGLPLFAWRVLYHEILKRRRKPQ